MILVCVGKCLASCFEAALSNAEVGHGKHVVCQILDKLRTAVMQGINSWTDTRRNAMQLSKLDFTLDVSKVVLCHLQ